MKVAIIIISIVGILAAITAINLKALADSVSEFDFWWEDDNYEEDAE